jgi:predicted Rossmann-fold nucleotide-binding protein
MDLGAATTAMNICVFCSAEELEEKYTKPAQEFAALLAKREHALIWGGSDRGLM